jgi:ubiquinone/menaquinone biosynthesis C-methylase UbiE
MASVSATGSRVLHSARFYDLGTALFERRLRLVRRRMIELAAVTSGARVLDVGCGPGRLTMAAAAIAGAGGETLGIDASPEMIALATEKAARAGSPATFRVASIEALPTPDGHFDAALASLMLHHLPPEVQRRGLAELLRVLRPGGRLVIADFSASPGHGLGHLLSVLGLRRGSDYAEHLRSLIAEAGFERVEIEPAPTRAFSFVHAQKQSAH